MPSRKLMRASRTTPTNDRPMTNEARRDVLPIAGMLIWKAIGAVIGILGGALVRGTTDGLPRTVATAVATLAGAYLLYLVAFWPAALILDWLRPRQHTVLGAALMHGLGAACIIVVMTAGIVLTRGDASLEMVKIFVGYGTLIGFVVGSLIGAARVVLGGVFE